MKRNAETPFKNITLSFVLGYKRNTTRKTSSIIIVLIRKMLDFFIHLALPVVGSGKDANNLH